MIALDHPTAGVLRRWHAAGNLRLADLRFDPAPECLALWDFVLSEEDRLRAAQAAGGFIVGAMKDLGTIPVLVAAIPRARAFYPDGAWWLPCLQRQSGGQLAAADRLGIGEGFCPVRALLGCYAAGSDFPSPDLDICAVGATCDDFSAVAQRLAGLGRDPLWWELPAFRAPDPGETAVMLPNGESAPAVLVAAVAAELQRVRIALGRATRTDLDDPALGRSIQRANQVRTRVRAIRELALVAPCVPLPAVELLLTEILALHFCSDLDRCLEILDGIHALVAARVARGEGHQPADAVRVLWLNPVADLRVLQWLEEAGGRLACTDFMTAQAMAPIPEDLPPIAALARVALCDRMIGSDRRRAALAVAEARPRGVEAVVVARVPGASHGCSEGPAMTRAVADAPWPVVAIEVPVIADAASGQIRGRLDALLETALARRTVRP
jgi:hypothetical protein